MFFDESTEMNYIHNLAEKKNKSFRSEVGASDLLKFFGPSESMGAKLLKVPQLSVV